MIRFILRYPITSAYLAFLVGWAAVATIVQCWIEPR